MLKLQTKAHFVSSHLRNTQTAFFCITTFVQVSFIANEICNTVYLVIGIPIPLCLHLHTKDSYSIFLGHQFILCQDQLLQTSTKGIMKRYNVQQQHLPLKHLSLDILRPDCFGVLHSQWKDPLSVNTSWRCLCLYKGAANSLILKYSSSVLQLRAKFR